VLFVAGLFGFNFLGTLYLQRVEHYSPLQASFAFLPLAVALAGISLGLAARLNLRFGPRKVLLAGLVLVILALALAARAPLHASYVTDVLPMMVLLGAGAGLAMPSILGLAMSVTNPQDAGVASGLSSTAAMAGGALGLGVLSSLSAGHMHDLLISGQSQQAAMYGGLHLAFFVAALTVVAGLLTGIIVWWPAPQAAGPRASAPESGTEVSRVPQ
jgi:MFS family permease